MDLFNSTICVSPETLNSTKRCTKHSFSQNGIYMSLFCENHSNLFRNEYLKYKKIESYIKLDLKTTDIRFLLKCYAQLEESYNRRYKYRKRAFVPEAWDVGHNIKMKKIIKNIDLVVSRLKILFKEEKIKNDLLDADKPSKSIDLHKTNTTYQNFSNIKKKHKKIIQQEENFESIINSFITKDELTKENGRKMYIKADKEMQAQLQVKYHPNVLIVIDIINYSISKKSPSSIVFPITITDQYIKRWSELMFFDVNIKKIFSQSYNKILKSEFCKPLYKNIHKYIVNKSIKDVNLCIYSVFNQQIYDFKGGYKLMLPLYSDKGKILGIPYSGCMTFITNSIEFNYTYTITQINDTNRQISCFFGGKIIYYYNISEQKNKYKNTLISIVYNIYERLSKGKLNIETIMLAYILKLEPNHSTQKQFEALKNLQKTIKLVESFSKTQSNLKKDYTKLKFSELVDMMSVLSTEYPKKGTGKRNRVLKKDLVEILNKTKSQMLDINLV